MKRQTSNDYFESQRSVDYDFSQSQTMPSYKKQRRGSYSGKKGMKNAVSRVPRAIATRGTPDGYYEIPANIMVRLFGNSSTGLWPTDQSTGAGTGLTGYNGFSIYSTLDSIVVNHGNGAVSAQTTVSIPQYSDLLSVFDSVKVVDMKVEMYVDCQVPGLSSSYYATPEVWVCNDPNDANPPVSLSDVCQRSKVKRAIADQRVTSLKWTPHMNLMANTSGVDTGTSETQAMSVPAGYCKTYNSAVTLFGMKGWTVVPSAIAPAGTYSVTFKISQTRRYKTNK